MQITIPRNEPQIKYFNLIFILIKNCKYLERMDLEECNQITDLTLAHLSSGCPSLEKLVSFFMLHFCGTKTSYLKHIFWSNAEHWGEMYENNCFEIFLDIVTLWTHNGRRHTTIGCWKLCCGKFICSWARQLPFDNGPDSRTFGVVS